MKTRTLITCLGTLLATPALAGPADYVYSPSVEQGEREIDFKIGSARQPSGDGKSAASLGFGYGASEHWFTEVYLKYEKTGGTGTQLEALEWENKFQLTETGEYPVDIGLITEFEIPRHRSNPYEFKIGPLFQTEFDKLQLNGNLLLERKYRGEDTDEPHNTEMGYQWQIKYRWQKAFEYGIQGFGEMGQWNHWDPSNEQNHRLGPAVFGKVALGSRHFLAYNAAWLKGVSDGAPNHTFRAQMEYEF